MLTFRKTGRSRKGISIYYVARKKLFIGAIATLENGTARIVFHDVCMSDGEREEIAQWISDFEHPRRVKVETLRMFRTNY